MHIGLQAHPSLNNDLMYLIDNVTNEFTRKDFLTWTKVNGHYLATKVNGHYLATKVNGQATYDCLRLCLHDKT